MRAWAIANGFDVEGYIRLPWSIVRAFEEAHAEPVDRTARPTSSHEVPANDRPTLDQSVLDRVARERPILRSGALPNPHPAPRPAREQGLDDEVPQLEFDRLETPPIGNPVV
jgi:hypothetical protein